MAECDDEMREFIRETVSNELKAEPGRDVKPLTELVLNKEARAALNEFRAAMGLETPLETTHAFQEIQRAHGDLVREAGKGSSTGGSRMEEASSSSYESSSDERSDSETEVAEPPGKKKKLETQTTEPLPSKKFKKGGMPENLSEAEAEQWRIRQLFRARYPLDVTPECKRFGRKNHVIAKTEFLWPKTFALSRFHREEQVAIVACLRAFPNCRRPISFKSKEEEWLWASFENLILGDRMALELQECRAELQNAAGKDLKHYAGIPSFMRHFYQNRRYRRRTRIRDYAPVYEKIDRLPPWVTPAGPGAASGLTRRPALGAPVQVFECLDVIAELGYVPTVEVPPLTPESALRMNSEKNLEKTFPPDNFGFRNPRFASNYSVSIDKNLGVMIPRYCPDVVMSAAGFKALLTLGRSASLADVPVVVVEKQGRSVVFVEKPLPAKVVTPMDKKALWFKYCAKEFLCKYPKTGAIRKKFQKLTKPEENRAGKEPWRPKRGSADGGESGDDKQQDEVGAALELADYEVASRPDEPIPAPPSPDEEHRVEGEAVVPSASTCGRAPGGGGVVVKSGTTSVAGVGGEVDAKPRRIDKSPNVPSDVAAGPSEERRPKEGAPKIRSVFDEILEAQADLFPQPAWKSAVGFRSGSDRGRNVTDRDSGGGDAADEGAVFQADFRLADVQKRLIHPAVCKNTCYRLWSLGNEEKETPLRLIIRTGDDGRKIDERTNRSTRCVVSAKMEFQYFYGYEFPSWVEAARNWADLCLRPGACLMRVHISPRFGNVYSVEERSLDQISQECANPFVDFDPVAALDRLSRILRRLTSLEPGQYMIKSEPPPAAGADSVSVENSVFICREVHGKDGDKSEKIYRFLAENEALKVGLESPLTHSPWRPVNPRQLTPFAVAYGRPPGTLWPTKSGFAKDGTRKYGLRHHAKVKERKKKARAAAAAKEAETKAATDVRVVDLSKRMPKF